MAVISPAQAPAPGLVPAPAYPAIMIAVRGIATRRAAEDAPPQAEYKEPGSSAERAMIARPWPAGQKPLLKPASLLLPITSRRVCR